MPVALKLAATSHRRELRKWIPQILRSLSVLADRALQKISAEAAIDFCNQIVAVFKDLKRRADPIAVDVVRAKIHLTLAKLYFEIGNIKASLDWAQESSNAVFVLIGMQGSNSENLRLLVSRLWKLPTSFDACFWTVKLFLLTP